ncbi:jg27687, partial [Pararge aegeria aegeria]
LDRAAATLPGHDTTDPTVPPSDPSGAADGVATTEKAYRPERFPRAPFRDSGEDSRVIPADYWGSSANKEVAPNFHIRNGAFIYAG